MSGKLAYLEVDAISVSVGRINSGLSWPVAVYLLPIRRVPGGLGRAPTKSKAEGSSPTKPGSFVCDLDSAQ